jgi:hypothetical protein
MMGLGKHSRNQDGRFRRERGDSLVRNLKKEYPQLEGINGNMRLDTLRERLGVDSLSKVLEKLERT